MREGGDNETFSIFMFLFSPRSKPSLTRVGIPSERIIKGLEGALDYANVASEKLKFYV